MFVFMASLLLTLGNVSSHHNSHLVANFSFSPLGTFDNGYPEEKYNLVIESFKNIYGPIIEERGGQLMILDDWTDGAVNMWAFRWGHEYWLEIPGGMSRYHLINEEAFILSICHELGHLLGGSPQRGDISLEGQSDYYAGSQCIEKMLTAIEPIKELQLEPDVEKACEDLQASKLELCRRSLKGGLSLTSYYAELESSPFPKLSTPSENVVEETLTTHPPSQCRLDTVYAGYKEKSRPPCWYKTP